jgi:hypothetical protein
MSPVTRSRTVLACLLALCALLAVGCSKKRGTPFDADAGHPDDWVANHGAAYRTTGGCAECHGDDLFGGISSVSCFSSARGAQACHSGGPGGHPVGWLQVHSVTDPSQAAACAVCHKNPANTLPPNCFNNSLCHGDKSGHPANWLTTHTVTDPSMASTCARCHDNKTNTLPPNCFNNSLCHGPKSNHPPGWITTHAKTNPAQAAACAPCHQSQPGTPGCFNNTLCHGDKGHPAGWDSPSLHGAAAKAANGFVSCEACHGATFTGGSSGQSCFPCHGWTAPHARSTWIGGGTAHTTTNQTNAPVCAQCHDNPQNSLAPGCFNASLCHGPQGTHPAGWLNASQHGAVAKAAPGPSSGIASCKGCHGAGYNGGSGPSCLTCHGGSAPHPKSNWTGESGRHRSTNTGNTSACAQCHGQIAGSPNCLNVNGCHGG